MPELSDTATHEEITSFVDAIVQERGGEEKSDAAKIAEERDELAVAEVDSGQEEDTAETGEESSESRDWIDDKLKAEVAAYGIDEEELSEFTSREEVGRALRLFDKRALESGRKSLADEGTPKRDPEGRFAKKEVEHEVQSKDGSYEVKLDKDVYDEEIISEFTRLRDHYESRVAALEARFIEADTRAEEERFDSLVDSLGHANLFGKSGKESAKELERRKDLFVAAKAMQIGLQELGRPTDLDEALVNRVSRMVFAEELAKKDLKARTQKVFKQSNSRLGGGATRAHDSVEPLRDEMRRLYKELEEAG